MRLIEAVIKPKIVFIMHYLHSSQVRNAVYVCGVMLATHLHPL